MGFSLGERERERESSKKRARIRKHCFPRTQLFKVLLIGDAGVGKSSMLASQRASTFLMFSFRVACVRILSRARST